MKKFLRTLSFIAVFVFILSSFCSCKKNPAARKKGDGETVMTVESYEIPKDLYRYFFDGYMKQYLGKKTVETDSDKALLEKKAKEETEISLKKMFAVYSLAAEYGIFPESDEIKSAAAASKESIIASEYSSDTDTFNNALAQSGMTDKVFEKIMEHEALENALYLKLTDEKIIDITKETFSEKINDETLARVKRVLIKYPDSYSYKDIIYSETDANREALEKADKVCKLLENGNDFDTVIKEYGEDIMMFQNPDGYYILKGNMEKAFEDVAFSLEVGAVSSPVITSDGVSVLIRLEPEDEYINKNLETLMKAYLEGQFNILIENKAAELSASEK